MVCESNYKDTIITCNCTHRNKMDIKMCIPKCHISWYRFLK